IILARPAPAKAMKQAGGRIRTFHVHVEDGTFDTKVFEELGRSPHRLAPVAEIYEHIRPLQHALYSCMRLRTKYSQPMARGGDHRRRSIGWRRVRDDQGEAYAVAGRARTQQWSRVW